MTVHKRKFAYDEEVDTESGPADASVLTGDDGAPIVDSSLCHRILTACIDRLNGADLDKVVDMLKGAELIDDDEVAELNAARKRGGGEEGEIGKDPMIASDHRYGLRRARTPTSEDHARFNAMYPDAARIKHLW